MQRNVTSLTKGKWKPTGVPTGYVLCIQRWLVDGEAFVERYTPPLNSVVGDIAPYPVSNEHQRSRDMLRVFSMLASIGPT